MHTIYTIEKELKALLDPLGMNDVAINGLQVANNGAAIERIGFAVDASLASIDRSIEEGCNLLITHHGFYWGKPFAITGNFYTRIQKMLSHNLGLIAFHLPLDVHPVYGNNAQIIALYEPKEMRPFGNYKGQAIGYQGELASSITKSQVLEILGVEEGIGNVNYLDFGKKEIKSIAVVSGGAPWEVLTAIDEGVDLYITGDSAHELYHVAKEHEINLLYAGHYHTEIFGVKALQKFIEENYKIETCFFDIPTGL